MNIFKSLFAKLYNVFSPYTKGGYSFLYHSIQDKGIYHFFSKDSIHNVFPEIFENHLKYLSSKGYAFITIDEHLKLIKKKRKVEKVVSISFDDGYSSVLNNALPALNKHSVPATFFLTTDLLYGKPLWRDKIRQIIKNEQLRDFNDFCNKKNLKFSFSNNDEFYNKTKDPNICNSKIIDEILDEFISRGSINESERDLYVKPEEVKKLTSEKNLQFGAHTKSHYVMSSLNYKEQYEEISDSVNILKGLGCELSNTFSIPFGNRITYNKNTMKASKELGFKGCLLSGGYKISPVREKIPSDINTFGLTLMNRFMPLNNKLNINGK